MEQERRILELEEKVRRQKFSSIITTMTIFFLALTNLHQNYKIAVIIQALINILTK